MDKDKIKITHITRFAKPNNGGVESFIEMFNSCVLSNDLEIEVLCNSNTEKSSIDERGVFFNRARYLFNFAANCISLEYLWKLSRVNTDVIIYHMPCIFAVIAHFIARPKFKKMIVCYHSDIIGYDKVMKPFWGIYRRFLAQADVIHVQSPQMLENSFVKDYKAKAVMISYLINTDVHFDRERVERIRQTYQGKMIVFALGRHGRYKGFEYLLEAMKDVDNAVLLLGGEGPLTETFREYINVNKLEEKIILLGRISQEELDDYYEVCDVFVLPSVMRSETFAVVQLEAMKHGKPVINTNLQTGVNYVSIDGETGLTVEPANSKALSGAINRLLGDEPLRLQYGQNARKRVSEIFNLSDKREIYINFFKGIFQ